MCYTEADERDMMLLGRDPATIKDPELKRRYWRLREEQDD